MATHPYQDLPDRAFWKRSVASIKPETVDPVVDFELRISPETKIATAGSCFAQHIARHLQKAGFNYYVTEPGHPILPEAIRQAHGYGLFSARYGNIYTARQLLQLLLRAFELFSPEEDIWSESNGSFLDPFRPTVQPRGFVSEFELRADRKQHFAAVRKMFETLDVFIFTLGLTECWASRADGAVFPVCPGVSGGEFDSSAHIFLNQDAAEVMSDMTQFIDTLCRINRNAEIVLTVSPVPLVATAEQKAHVLTATTYSKSVLRVAAEALRKRFQNVHYFPSYEIVTGAYNRGRYFAADLRNVTEEAVEHVMRVFLEHAAKKKDYKATNASSQKKVKDAVTEAEELVAVECDEVALDKAPPTKMDTSVADRGVLLTSIPMADNHLLLKILEGAISRRGRPFKKNQDFLVIDPQNALFYGHGRYSQLQNIDPKFWRILVLIRDPRDILLSTLDALSSESTPENKNTHSLISGLSREQQLIALINGIGSYPAIWRRCSGWLEWREKDALIVRYEDIVDGSALESIAAHLGLDENLIKRAASRTLRKRSNGHADLPIQQKAFRWRNEISAEVLDHFNKAAPSLLKEMGYLK